MQVLIDNKDITDYGITCLDYTGALSFPSERVNERVWADKSGVDKNLENIRFDSKEFILKCIVNATTEGEAYNRVKTLVNDLFTRGAVVLSLRDTQRSIRECFLCERSGALIGAINIRTQNSLYYFKLGMKDVNPAAVLYKTTVAGLSATITYDKGQNAAIYWGDGTRGLVSNSGIYTKGDYASNGDIDIIIDVDGDAPQVNPLIAAFTASHTVVEKPFTITFTSESVGDIEIYSWDFGDGTTSSEANPTHEYTEEGQYTVSLQVFNAAQGSDTEIKVNYIEVRPQDLLISTGNAFLIDNVGSKLLIN